MPFTITPQTEQTCRQCVKDLLDAEETCRRAAAAGYDMDAQVRACQYYRQLMEGTIQHLAQGRKD